MSADPDQVSRQELCPSPVGIVIPGLSRLTRLNSLLDLSDHLFLPFQE